MQYELVLELLYKLDLQEIFRTMAECKELTVENRFMWARESLIYALCNDYMGVAVSLWEAYRDVFDSHDKGI